MLVQSTGNDLYLLPAIPRDKWPYGCVKGLRARGGLTVNICWKEGSFHEALLWSSSGQNSFAMLNLHYGDQTASIRLSPGQVYRLGTNLKCVSVKNLTLWEYIYIYIYLLQPEGWICYSEISGTFWDASKQSSISINSCMYKNWCVFSCLELYTACIYHFLKCVSKCWGKPTSTPQFRDEGSYLPKSEMFDGSCEPSVGL
jgi:hypothetical protein